MNVLVTGGCGYKGSVLVPKLLDLNFNVHVIDTLWFGNYFQPHENLFVEKMDIRAIDEETLAGKDVIIHLASVANDPCGDLNPNLTWEISALGTMLLVDKAVRCGVESFIYASSGSVYGIQEAEKVTEELPLKPISGYNKTKMIAERVLLSYADKISLKIVRPATVCGLSPRMRLDVAVNLLTMQALTKNEITVLGGSQIRPNIHIEDVTDIYIKMLLNKNAYSGIYNAGFENLSILSIAKMIQEKTDSKIIINDSNDPRSYRISSDKIINSGFSPTKSVNNAIDEIITGFKNSELHDDENHYNLKWMQKIKVA